MKKSAYTRRAFLQSFSWTAASLVISSCSRPEVKFSGPSSDSKRPNILLIMADDMGYSDIGCYGSEIQTPHLDQLASNGLRFTQFYNAARCCPTRASLLTGLYPHQAGIGHMMTDKKLPGYQGDLNTRCVTLAEVLKGAGYATYMSGKWHVTKHKDPGSSRHNWPCQRGFDRFFGTIHGAGSFYDPNSLTRDNTQIVPHKDFYYTNAIADNAIDFLAGHHQKQPEAPFFMYVPFTCPHWPMHALPGDIAKYKGRYDKGWDALRAERYERMIQMGLVDKNWPLTPRDTHVPSWEDAEMKEWHAGRMEVYAAMVDNMDQNIGKIIAHLKKMGQLDNTLIFFLADNGGCAEEFGSGGAIRPDPAKPVELQPMAPGELQTAMRPKVTRDGRPVRSGRGVMPGPADTFVAYGLPWANASNTPFRRYKHWVHEGGIASPLIVHWPGGIKKDHGEFRQQPAHLIDIMTTCVDVAGATYPTVYKGHEITPMEGRSLTPAFDDNDPIDQDAIYWEHEGNRAIRVDNWKLVAKGARGPWELYDLKKDRTELNDLAEKYPEKAKELAGKWTLWAKRANVLPWPWKKK
ncbi:MAG: arylsulfatase [Phycisphaerae bacterium]|nr:arylsulfatase [Phycisphaerae bacterium]